MTISTSVGVTSQTAARPSLPRAVSPSPCLGFQPLLGKACFEGAPALGWVYEQDYMYRPI